ncbi:MAG TPA: alpha/beta hydrolase [Kofleriaceae bacterium]|jgi:pimeloyl-ACP methyl ester carboxylesterase
MSISLDVVAPARCGSVNVATARRMAWSEWGPNAGVPVLFSPGAATSSSLGFAASALERLRVRLIAIDRPGLGESDAARERTLADDAHDVAALVSALSLDQPAIVGFSQGAPLALACAAAGSVSAVAFVSGTDELAAPSIRSALPPEIQQHIALAHTDPLSLEAMFRGMNAAMMISMIDASPAVDLAVYKEPTFVAAFASAVNEGLARGSDGLARDARLAMSPWPFDPSAIGVPVHLWYGSVDTSPFHSPDHGASLARRIPNAARTVIEGSGGAVLWTHGAEILGALLEARRRSL